MDSFTSSQFPRSFASMPSVPPYPTLPTVHSGHLPTNLRPSDANPRRDHAKKRRNDSAEPNETGKTASSQGAREQIRTGQHATHHLRSQFTSRPNDVPESYHFPQSSHQYASEGGGSDFRELDIALQTSQMSRRRALTSTIKEDEEADNSKHAAYTKTKEWGRLSTQVGQRLLDATTRNKTLLLVSSLTILHSSLGIGVNEVPGGKSREPNGQAGPVDWVDGVAILIALSILKKNRRHALADDPSGQQEVKVVRGDVQKTVNVKKLVVGDIVLIEPGDTIPCDGILITGQGVKCEESGPTGASDITMKTTYCNFIKLHPDCFMIAGSRVIDGIGRYVVVAAPESATMATSRRNSTNTSSLGGLTRNGFSMLKPADLSELIVNVGSLAAWTLFAASAIRCLLLAVTGGHARSATQNSVVLVTFFTLAVSVVVGVGSAEASKTKKQKSGHSLVLNVYDNSSHTNIHDSYNASHRHTTNSNNDSSARYSVAGSSSILPIVDQRRDRPFIQPTYASHYSTSPDLRHERLPPVSLYGAPYRTDLSTPYCSFGSQSPQPRPSSAYEPMPAGYQSTPIPASGQNPSEGHLRKATSFIIPDTFPSPP